MRSRLLYTFFFILLWACSQTPKVSATQSLQIYEINPNKGTALTKQNLLQLGQVYDISPFLFTKKIFINPNVISHSSPVLTLNTRFAEQPNKLLSLWLHEELHWWLMQNPENAKKAMKELRKVYPKIPSNSQRSPYLHLIVCYLEYKALAYYIGETGAKNVITSMMKKDKLYPWIYYQVLYKNFAIKRIVEENDLLPEPLS